MRKNGSEESGELIILAIISTDRLFLREMTPDDFQALFKVLGDPETMWHYPFTYDGQHVRDWIERNMNRYRENGFGL
ncbi:MAG: GNAT family N-acetyltransferase, partial [Oscillospiraceae bacterium]|nr:GNAT family N-acetyltransferase [Oscillospiraceae bacterium]